MSSATLDELILAVRAEIGDSTSMSQGLDALPAFRQIINRVQETYYLDYDWPNLIFNPEENIVAGERYYTFNEGINFDRIFGAWVMVNGQWEPMEYGIDPEHYNQRNSDLGETDSYPLRWNHYDDRQFEIWPIPSQPTKIRFRCVRALNPMKAGTDQCLLDKTLIVLTAAAEMATRNKLEDARLKLAQATAHYVRLKGRFNKVRIIPMNDCPAPRRPFTPRAPR